jgi:hypothetical protein
VADAARPPRAVIGFASLLVTEKLTGHALL